MGKVGSWLGQLLGNSAGDIVEKVGSTVDRFVTTKEEQLEADHLKRELELRFKQLEFEAEQSLLADRQSAREMYAHDSSLQKVFAIVFLAGYLAMSGLMVWLVLSWIPSAGVTLEMPEWAVVLITSVFTAMSTKVNTITDFLFGGSQGERDNSSAITNQVRNQARD